MTPEVNEGWISLFIGFSRLQDAESLFIIFFQYWGIHLNNLVQISGKYSSKLFSVPMILTRTIWVKQQFSQLLFFTKYINGWYPWSLCFSARFTLRKQSFKIVQKGHIDEPRLTQPGNQANYLWCGTAFEFWTVFRKCTWNPMKGGWMKNLHFR